jgi:thioredoxin 1
MLPAGFTALDEFDYHPRLAACAGAALVLFSSAACGTCRSVERRLPAAAPAGMPLYHVDAQVSAGLTRAMEIFHLPALFLYRQGHYHARLDCPVLPDSLRAAIDQALAAPAEDEP